jgi:uncharacterized spore protein YtfJ
MTTTDTTQGSALADELVQRIGRAVGDNARASAIFGEAVERDGITVIPVARSRFGFGGGAGTGPREDDSSGGGGGGGGAVTPVGYIELHDGTARFRRIVTPTDLLPVVGAALLGVLVLGRLVRR